MFQFTKHQNEKLYKSYDFSLELLAGESVSSATFSAVKYDTVTGTWVSVPTSDIIDESSTKFETNVFSIFFIDGQAHEEQYRVVADVSTGGLTPSQVFVLVYEVYIAQDEVI